MEEKKAAIIFITAIFIDLLGPPDALLRILLVCIALDYFTGLLRAAYQRRLSSKIGAKGIIKKIGYLSAVVLAHQFDLWLGTGDEIRSLAVSLFIANEGWSNIENLAAIGIGFPKLVLDKLRAIMANGDKEVSGADEKH